MDSLCLSLYAGSGSANTKNMLFSRFLMDYDNSIRFKQNVF